MIVLYHGGTEVFKEPRVDVGRSGLDFGKGFYATSMLEQAKKWAQRTSKQRMEPPVINVFDYDEEKASAFRGWIHKRYDRCCTCIDGTFRASA